MSRPDVDAIRARAESATPGPWIQGGWVGGHFYEDENMITTPPPRVTLIAGNLGEEEGGIVRDEDTAFITAARTDVPALLDYVAELETLLSIRSGAGHPHK